MLYFCTLFDNNYLSRGLAMYESLRDNCNDFHLYILAFNDISYTILTDLKLPNCSIINLSDFENEQLLKIKTKRSIAEYCWTCTPSLIYYCIKTFNLPHCTYIDADLYFYSNPNILIEELGNDSILLSPHWYTSVYDKSTLTGIYCVQFLTFKNDNHSLEALNWWKNACIEWCYARFEDGKFGDQKYLDDWLKKFQYIHILTNKGGGFAPWNIQQYKPVKSNNTFYYNKYDKKYYNVIFYHFHDIIFRNDNKIDFGTYFIPRWAKKRFYYPYLKHFFKIEENLKNKYNYSFHNIKIVNKPIIDNLLTLIQKYYILKYIFFVIFDVILKKLKNKKEIRIIKLQPILKKVLFNRNIYSIKKILED